MTRPLIASCTAIGLAIFLPLCAFDWACDAVWRGFERQSVAEVSSPHRAFEPRRWESPRFTEAVIDGVFVPANTPTVVYVFDRFSGPVIAGTIVYVRRGVDVSTFRRMVRGQEHDGAFCTEQGECGVVSQNVIDSSDGATVSGPGLELGRAWSRIVWTGERLAVEVTCTNGCFARATASAAVGP